MSDEPEPLVLHQIVITSALRQGDGAPMASVQLPEEAGLIEILGLLEFAKFYAYRDRQGLSEEDS